MKNKKRLDVLLTERFYADTRSKAQAIIMAGLVYVDGQKADKPGVSYEDTVTIEVRGETCPYVSRGGVLLKREVSSPTAKRISFISADVGTSLSASLIFSSFSRYFSILEVL